MPKKEFSIEQEKLSRYAKALGHPIRVAILQMLACQNAVITETCQKCCR